jgi:hypothetical protein
MSRPVIDRAPRLIGAATATILLGASLGGCSNPDVYFDRRDTMALSAGDALAANKAEQMVDPWPAQSGNKNIGFNGERMQGAIERYRTHKETQPVSGTADTAPTAQAQNVTQVSVNGSSSPASSASSTSSASSASNASTQ